MRIIKNGILSTFQDYGRDGYASIGVNRSGAMDTISFTILNLLLRNPSHTPALEMHFPAPEILFEEACEFALYGADFSPMLNQKSLVNGKLYSVKPGDTLRFKKHINGQRCYFGIRGKMDLESWLGSFSQNAALKHPAFKTDIVLIPDDPINKLSGISPLGSPKSIQFVPEFDYFDLNKASIKLLQTQEFCISSDSNRMGYRLSGPTLKLKAQKQAISSAVSKGTIQLLPDGQLIILMADAQTIGGYPKIGYISAVDLNYLSQMSPNACFKLKAISEKDAIDSIRTQTELYERLAKTLKISI